MENSSHLQNTVSGELVRRLVTDPDHADCIPIQHEDGTYDVVFVGSGSDWVPHTPIAAPPNELWYTGHLEGDLRFYTTLGGAPPQGLRHGPFTPDKRARLLEPSETEDAYDWSQDIWHRYQLVETVTPKLADSEP